MFPGIRLHVENFNPRRSHFISPVHFIWGVSVTKGWAACQTQVIRLPQYPHWGIFPKYYGSDGGKVSVLSVQLYIHEAWVHRNPCQYKMMWGYYLQGAIVYDALQFKAAQGQDFYTKSTCLLLKSRTAAEKGLGRLTLACGLDIRENCGTCRVIYQINLGPTFI